MTEPERPGRAGDRSTSAADLERFILGGTPERSGADISEAVGVPLGEARRYWRALGLPDASGDSAFTDADEAALRLITQSVADSGLDRDMMMSLLRAVGRMISRLADWEVANLASALEDFGGADDPRAPAAMRATLDLLETLAPRFDQLIVYAWRRHLAAAVGRIDMFGATDEDLHVAQATVGFADLVQFTALSNELDQHELGDLVEIFESRCADIITDHGGKVIKTLGDSVLFTEVDPAQAIDIALAIIAVIGRDARLPDVRLGLATGPVVLRMGDVYGPPVNLAARFTSVARRNRVIVDERTAALLPAGEFETRPLPARPIRGFGDLEPYTVRRTRPRH